MCGKLAKEGFVMNLRFVLQATVLFFFVGWQAGQGKELSEMAHDVADGVGEVRATWNKGSSGPVFIFEEFHTSRIGQHQIAVMLLRLHDRYELQQIGLEGGLQSPEPLDTGWFRQLGTPSVTESSSDATKVNKSASNTQQDVALRMLGEGEISAAEFTAMVLGDVQVHGLEIASQYNQKPDTKGAPAAEYLLKIAEKKLTQADIVKINELAQAGKTDEALKYLTQADPWVRAQFEAMKKTDLADLHELAKQMRDIRAKARELGVSVDHNVDEEFDRTLKFYDTATERSATMASYMAKSVATSHGKPSAMVIGAAHSKEIEAAFEKSGVDYVLLRPLAFGPESKGNLTTEQFERKSEVKWGRTSSGTIGRLLNSNRKPPPFIGTATAKGYASALYAIKWIAATVRHQGRVPDEVRARLSNLPDCVVHFDSIRVDGYDVIFRLTLKDTNGNDKEVWVRAGSTAPNEPAKTLEQRLLQQISDLGWSGAGNNIPPRDPPKDSVAAGDMEGPGDGNRKETVIARVSDSVVAVFTENAEQAAAVGRISS
jgi:hypothetical protein